jgi:hypothetical protein
MVRFGPYASACNAFEAVAFERLFEINRSACPAKYSRHSETVLPLRSHKLKSLPPSAKTEKRAAVGSEGCLTNGTVNQVPYDFKYR